MAKQPARRDRGAPEGGTDGLHREQYDRFSDEELIRLHRDGDPHAQEVLIARYKELVRRRADSMAAPTRKQGVEKAELIQEGMIGLFRAAQDYDCGRDASYRTFAALCVDRRMYTYIRNHVRLKNMPLNSALSLQAQIAGEDGGEESGGTLEDILSEQNVRHMPSGALGKSPEEQLIAEERMEMLLLRMEETLSDFETDVCYLMQTGIGYAEIARVLNRDAKSVDNAIQRIRSKLRRILKERER